MDLVVELDSGEPLGEEIFRGGNSVLRPWRGDSSLLLKDGEGFADRADELLAQIQWRAWLSQEERDFLDTFAAWPRHVVRVGGRPRGILIPLAQPRFMRSGRGRPATRDIGRLAKADLKSPDRVTEVAPQLLAAFGQVIRHMVWFHERGVLVNDLHPNNILVTEEASAVYLVDCDSMSGPWGNGGGAAAPMYLRDLFADPHAQGRNIDFAKLAYSIVHLSLADAGISEIGPRARQRLAKIMHNDAIMLVERTLDPDNYDEQIARRWKQLGSLWESIGKGERVRTEEGLVRWDPAAASGPTPSRTERVETEPVETEPAKVEPGQARLAGSVQRVAVPEPSGGRPAARAPGRAVAKSTRARVGAPVARPSSSISRRRAIRRAHRVRSRILATIAVIALLAGLGVVVWAHF